MNSERAVEWIRFPELKGKVFVPQARAGSGKKHPCPQCFACQMCSDDRCNACCKLPPAPIQANETTPDRAPSIPSAPETRR
jgi:hypothetical protein